ncbi:hypothetical protein D3C76_1112520 [compost metagenome]
MYSNNRFSALVRPGAWSWNSSIRLPINGARLESSRKGNTRVSLSPRGKGCRALRPNWNEAQISSAPSAELERSWYRQLLGQNSTLGSLIEIFGNPGCTMSIPPWLMTWMNAMPGGLSSTSVPSTGPAKNSRPCRCVRSKNSERISMLETPG